MKDINPVYTRSGVDFISNGRSINPSLGFRAVSISSDHTAMSVRFRKRAGDPGNGPLTTYQDPGKYVVISYWNGHDNTGILIDDGTKQVPLYEAKEVWAAIRKEEPWIEAWLSNRFQDENYLPEDVFPPEADNLPSWVDNGYDKFFDMYQGTGITLNQWVSIGRSNRALSPTIMPSSWMGGYLKNKGAHTEFYRPIGSGKFKRTDMITEATMIVSINVGRNAMFVANIVSDMEYKSIRDYVAKQHADMRASYHDAKI